MCQPQGIPTFRVYDRYSVPYFFGNVNTFLKFFYHKRRKSPIFVILSTISTEFVFIFPIDAAAQLTQHRG